MYIIMDIFNSIHTQYKLSYGTKNGTGIIYIGEDDTEYRKCINDIMNIWDGVDYTDNEMDDIEYMELYNDGKIYRIYKSVR
jgi:hypothetical protein